MTALYYVPTVAGVTDTQASHSSALLREGDSPKTLFWDRKESYPERLNALDRILRIFSRPRKTVAGTYRALSLNQHQKPLADTEVSEHRGQFSGQFDHIFNPRWESLSREG